MDFYDLLVIVFPAFYVYHVVFFPLQIYKYYYESTQHLLKKLKKIFFFCSFVPWGRCGRGCHTFITSNIICIYGCCDKCYCPHWDFYSAAKL